MVARTTFCLDREREDSLLEVEHCWRLIEPDDGTPYIEHEQTRDYPYASRAPHTRTETMLIDEFLNGDYPEKAKASLRETLKKRGLR